MTYPTLEEVEKADRFQICYWWRFLPSPGASALDCSFNSGNSEYFEQVLEKETEIMNKIAARFKELGGFTPEISKRIGWSL